MAQNGGARPGAGRKPKDEKFKIPIAKAEQKIADKLPWLIDQAMELAEGVIVQERDKDGSPRIYQRPPDIKAITYLVDRIMGKPTERNDVTISTDNWIFDPTEKVNPPATDDPAA